MVFFFFIADHGDRSAVNSWFDFQSKWDEFEQEGFKILAASVDSKDITKAYAEELELGFPVGYGLDAETVSELTGAFLSSGKKVYPCNRFFNSRQWRGGSWRITAPDRLAVS